MIKGQWRTSTFSGGGDQCVEVKHDAVVSVRDTKDRDGGTLTLSPEAWQNFVEGVKGDEFNN